MTTSEDGTLEVDHERGVIYFHTNKGVTKMRISGMPVPVMKVLGRDGRGMLDINVKEGHCNWQVPERYAQDDDCGA